MASRPARSMRAGTEWHPAPRPRRTLRDAFSMDDPGEFFSNELLGSRPARYAQRRRPTLRRKRERVFDRWTTAAGTIEPFSGFPELSGELEEIAVLELIALRHGGRNLLDEGFVPREPLRGEEPHVAVVRCGDTRLRGFGTVCQGQSRCREDENCRKSREPGHGFLLTGR